MSYIDGFVIAVPTANREKFITHAKMGDSVFIDMGATRVIECWGDDVPEGKVTDFRKAVDASDDETVAELVKLYRSELEKGRKKFKFDVDPNVAAAPLAGCGVRGRPVLAVLRQQHAASRHACCSSGTERASARKGESRGLKYPLLVRTQVGGSLAASCQDRATDSGATN